MRVGQRCAGDSPVRRCRELGRVGTELRVAGLRRDKNSMGRARRVPRALNRGRQIDPPPTQKNQRGPANEPPPALKHPPRPPPFESELVGLVFGLCLCCLSAQTSVTHQFRLEGLLQPVIRLLAPADRRSSESSAIAESSSRASRPRSRRSRCSCSWLLGPVGTRARIPSAESA